MIVGIYGLGNIGSALKNLLLKHPGFEVRGYDPRYTSSDSIEYVNQSDLIWICVDTPTKSWGDSIHDQPSDYDYTNLKSALASIDTGVPVIVGCTVSPGTCSTLEYNGDLYYMPFLISQGDVTSGLVGPDCWFVGSNSDTQIIRDLINRFSVSPVHTGTFEEAELAKVLYNSWIIQKINFANWAGELAYHLDADGHKVMDWLKSSSKLITSDKYMTPGWGDGGPCHPRDNLMMSWLGAKLGLEYDPAGNNHSQRIAQAHSLAHRANATGLPVIILGKSYKPGIESTTGSYSLLVAQFIQLPVYYEDYREPGDYCYILAHNEWYGHVPSENSIIINPWKE